MKVEQKELLKFSTWRSLLVAISTGTGLDIVHRHPCHPSFLHPTLRIIRVMNQIWGISDISPGKYRAGERRLPHPM